MNVKIALRGLVPVRFRALLSDGDDDDDDDDEFNNPKQKEWNN